MHDFEEIRRMRSRLEDIGTPPPAKSMSEAAHLLEELTDNALQKCQHCGAQGTTVGLACYRCVVLCTNPGCSSAADPADLGKMCPEHVVWLVRGGGGGF